MKKVAALLLLLVVLIGVILHFAELFDVYCETDADCKQPTICRLVCQKNCKSICVLMMEDTPKEGKEEQVIQNDADELSSHDAATSSVDNNRINWWSMSNNNNKKPVMHSADLYTLNAKQQAAFLQRRQLHRKPSVLRSDEEPFDTETNIFAAAAVPIKQPQVPLLPPPLKASNLPPNVTPLTISEGELEAELRQLTGPDNVVDDDGPIGFVTAPGNEAVTTMRTPFKQETTNLQKLFALVSPSRGNNGRIATHQLQQETSASGGSMPKLMALSTSMELVSDESQMPRQQQQTVFTLTTVSAPSFSPEPPGFTPTTTISTIPFATKETTTATTTFTTAQAALPTTVTLQPLSTYSSTTRTKITGYASEEEFEQHKNDGIGNKHQQFFQMMGTESPWFHKMRPSDMAPVTTTTESPLMQMGFSLRRTTQRVPTHRPYGSGEGTTAAITINIDNNAAITTTTMRTTLRKCGTPPVCRRNCGIVIDWDGCQSCQCLWTSKTCFSDRDCRSLGGQVCDLGRCECGPGYEHNPQHSGICQQINSRDWNKHPVIKQMPMKLLEDPIQSSTYPSPTPINLGRNFPTFSSQFASPILISGRSHHQVPTDRHFYSKSTIQQQAYHWRRLKKRMAEISASISTPHREERFQWPKPCDSDEQCPAQLYCLQGDCWSLNTDTDRVLRQRQRDTATLPLQDAIRRSGSSSFSSHESAMVRTMSPKHLPTVTNYQKRLSPLIGSEHHYNKFMQKQIPQTSNADGSNNVLFPTLLTPIQQQNQGLTNDTEGRQTFAANPLSPIIKSPIVEKALASASSFYALSTTTAFAIPVALVPSLSNHDNYNNEEADDNANTDDEYQDEQDAKKWNWAEHEVRKEQANENYKQNHKRLLTVATNAVSYPPSAKPLTDSLATGITESSTIATSPSLTLQPTTEISNTGLEKLVPTDDEFGVPKISNLHNHLDQSHFEPMKQNQTGIKENSEVVNIWKNSASSVKDKRPIFLDYSHTNRIRRPVRVEMVNSREFMKDECHESRDCGQRFVCCLKYWCDLGNECGLAKFCLPSCELTKLTHLSELIDDESGKAKPRMDLIYD